MRQLFVPACLCLMMSSNSTGFDLPIEKLPGSSTFDKRILMRAASGTGSVRDELAHENVEQAQTDVADTDSAVAEVPDDGVDAAQAGVTPPQPEKIPLPPVPKPVIERSRAEICDTLAKAAQSNALPVPFFIRLLFQESRFEPGVVSSAGAQGIAQFMPETASDEGLVNPFDPLQAIPASARLLHKLFAQFGNLGLAAAAYNAGPKRIQDWLAKKDTLPQETKGYVKTVTGRPAESWRLASASGTELTLPRRAPCKEAVPAPVHSMTASRAPAAAHTKKSTHRVAAAKTGKPAKIPAQRHKTAAGELAAHKPENRQVAQR